MAKRKKPEEKPNTPGDSPLVGPTAAAEAGRDMLRDGATFVESQLAVINEHLAAGGSAQGAMVALNESLFGVSNEPLRAGEPGVVDLPLTADDAPCVVCGTSRLRLLREDPCPVCGTRLEDQK
jgi:hypothetical protein